MKITTIIPTKKDRGYLKHTINSIKNQTYKNHQILIGKGGTVGENINSCIPYIKGDLVMYIADDDLLPSNAFEIVVDNFPNDVDFIHGNALRFKGVGHYLPYNPNIPRPTIKDLIKSNVIHGGTCYYRSELFRSNSFDEELGTGEEWEFNLRLLSQGYKIDYINQIIFYYRLHENQKSIGNLGLEYQSKRNLVKELIKSRYANFD